jgi:hypothetical protein
VVVLLVVALAVCTAPTPTTATAATTTTTGGGTSGTGGAGGAVRSGEVVNELEVTVGHGRFSSELHCNFVLKRVL